jgi:hypothetical protein
MSNLLAQTSRVSENFNIPPTSPNRRNSFRVPRLVLGLWEDSRFPRVRADSFDCSSTLTTDGRSAGPLGVPVRG